MPVLVNCTDHTRHQFQPRPGGDVVRIGERPILNQPGTTRGDVRVQCRELSTVTLSRAWRHAGSALPRSRGTRGFVGGRDPPWPRRYR